jgi:hypothetical protein
VRYALSPYIKQIRFVFKGLIDAKLKAGKRGQKAELAERRPLRRRRSASKKKNKKDAETLKWRQHVFSKYRDKEDSGLNDAFLFNLLL